MLCWHVEYKLQLLFHKWLLTRHLPLDCLRSSYSCKISNNEGSSLYHNDSNLINFTDQPWSVPCFQSRISFVHSGINFAVLHTELGLGITFAPGSLLRAYSWHQLNRPIRNVTKTAKGSPCLLASIRIKEQAFNCADNYSAQWQMHMWGPKRVADIRWSDVIGGWEKTSCMREQ